MTTNGITQIEMQTMQAIIDTAQELESINDSLKSIAVILTSIRKGPKGLTEDEKWNIHDSMKKLEIRTEVERYAEENGINDLILIEDVIEDIYDYVYRFDEEEIKEAFDNRRK